MSQVNSPSITAVILAGGKGRRFAGNDKGLLIFKQRRLIEYLLEAIAPQVSNIIINANRNQQTYANYGYTVISDAMSDYQGPLAGFSVAMQKATTSHIITLPCDAPLVSPDYIKRMSSALQQSQAELAVAHDGKRLQPVHALIPVTLNDSLDNFLQAGDRKIDLWYQRHTMLTVDFSDTPTLFENINTAEQLAALEASKAILE